MKNNGIFSTKSVKFRIADVVSVSLYEDWYTDSDNESLTQMFRVRLSDGSKHYVDEDVTEMFDSNPAEFLKYLHEDEQTSYQKMRFQKAHIIEKQKQAVALRAAAYRLSIPQ